MLTGRFERVEILNVPAGISHQSVKRSRTSGQDGWL